MALLTGIVTPVRGRRMRILFVDHEPWRETSAEVAALAGVKEGLVFEPHELSERLSELEPRAARERALQLLMYRDRSAHDMTRRLLEDGYPLGVVEQVIAAMLDSGLLDDQRFAGALVRVMSEVRGYGRLRISRELDSHGIDPEVASEALDEVFSEDEEYASALRLATALAARPAIDVQRIAARLARKGFRTGTAFKAAREALAAADHGDGSEQGFS